MEGGDGNVYCDKTPKKSDDQANLGTFPNETVFEWQHFKLEIALSVLQLTEEPGEKGIFLSMPATFRSSLYCCYSPELICCSDQSRLNLRAGLGFFRWEPQEDSCYLQS